MEPHPITSPDQPHRPLDDEALAAHYPPPEPDRPWLRANFVTSADGAVTVAGRSGPLSDPADQRLLGLLRRGCQVLLIGAGTLRAERYGPMALAEPERRWRIAHGLAPDPVLAVVSGSLDLDPEQPVFSRAPVRPVVFTTGRAPRRRREAFAATTDLVVVGETARDRPGHEPVLPERAGPAETVDMTAAVAHLHRHGLRQILCEGGPHLFGHLTAADLVDELCLTVSGQLAGPGAGRITAGPASPPRPMRLRHLLTAGDTLFLRYLRSR